MSLFYSVRSIAFVLAAAILLPWPAAAQPAAESALDYPPSKTADVVDDYHGTQVADPYRWLEDLNSADTKAWVDAQNAVTHKYLESLPLRASFRRRITELWDYPKVSTPWRVGGKLWYRKNSGLQRQAAVYAREKIDSAPVPVLDPNTLSPDGSISLEQIAPSPDGKLLAYTLSEGGADWRKVRVRDLVTGADLVDSVEWVRYSRIAWTHDSKGFFYSRYPTPPAGKHLEAPIGIHSLYYHGIGTPQSADRLIFEEKGKPDWFVTGHVTDDGLFLIIRISQRSARKNRLFYIDLGDPKEPNFDAGVTPMVGTGDALYRVLGNVGSVFYVLSNAAAPRGLVFAVDIRRAEPVTPQIVIPHGPHVIQNAKLSGGKIVVQYLVNLQSRVKLFALDGKELGTLALPGVGTIRNLSGRYDSDELFYRYTSPLYPSVVFVCRRLCRASVPFEAGKSPFDPRKYETRQFLATSKDGTRVPYFLTAQKQIKRDGSNPTMLYGYGGFSNSVTPSYRPDLPAWLERGGIFVTANVRGGGAYGEEWHRGGMLENKQNSFDDFVAVAEDLIKRGYTSPAKLAIQGGSNGGLLVGAVINQRPELFAAALPAVGVMDMLRYDKFTSGAAWVSEYGASSDAKMFSILYRYSPLHNLKAGTCHPATLVLTADHDDRVVPSHSFKYLATLQAAQNCKRPVLLRVEKQASHRYRPTDRMIAELADSWAFVAAWTGMFSAGDAAADQRPQDEFTKRKTP
ncbi:MAG: prolyl oligopeptidase family serine peptidase [Candidatus Binatia bacterium]